ncbi:MAG TPA: protein kinase [Vicinamibacterales bacterium]|nr:protein kinase [Vicinamibacterales bacterium]
MRPDPARALENLAASIADGAPVDWERTGAQLSGGEQRLVRHLRLIDRLAEVYRTLPPEAGDVSAVDPLTEADPAGPRWGRLILLDRIGRGASGDVFRAWEVDLQREVALKLLRVDGVTGDAAANARVLQEARRLARIRHPHVAHVYGAERHEGRIGLWMELVRGRPLDEVVRVDGPMTPDAAARIGADLSSAVAAVHAAGLLHRDIKAQNVARDESGRIILMDFGAGEDVGSAPRLAGTPLYLAPELLAGGRASPASDVYSLGVLLFHLVTGAFPVHAESVEALAAAHRHGDRRRLRTMNSKIPVAFARVVERALAAEPSARYATAAAMEHALRELVSRSEAAGGRRTTRWRGWVAAMITAASVIALVATLLRSRDIGEVGPHSLTSVAVLPLTAMSGGPETTALAEGLTDQIITTLGQVQALRVTAHTSVVRFKSTTQPVSAIAQQLGVQQILEGTVAVQPGAGGRPGRVRVNARLIEAGTDVEIWSGSLERPMGDLLALEDDLARAVARQMHAKLSGSEMSRLQTRRGTNPAAEQAYLEGRMHLGQFGARAALALDAFKRALALDPGYAAAHAGAARSYVALGFDRTISQPDARASALSEVTRALDLDPDLPEAHGVLADLRFYYDWDFSGAEREYRLALDLEPSASYTRAQYAQFLAAVGRLDEARQQVTESVTLDPLSAPAELTRSLVLYYTRRFDEALAAAHRAESLDPTLPTTHFLEGRILEAKGDLTAALRETQRAIDTSALVAVGWRVQAMRLQALQGDVRQARAQFSALAAGTQGDNLGSSPHEAYFLLATGQPDAALAVLGRAVSQRDPSVLWLDVDPRLDPVRDRPEFAALRKRIGLP